MPAEKKRYSIHIKPLLILALTIFFFQPLHSQIPVKQDTVIKVAGKSFIRFRNLKKLSPRDTIITVSPTLQPVLSFQSDKTVAFYDSLKVKASKSILTKA